MIDEVIKLSRHFLSIKNQAYQRYFLKTVPMNHRCLIILGQRGVGKTTTLIQYLLQYSDNDIYNSKILYVQTDHFLLAKYSLYEIAEEFSTLGGQIIAFDEIHKYQGWSNELKSILDTFPNLKIIASGSSALEIHKSSHDLSRRSIIQRLYGMSFREYLEIRFNLKLPACKLFDIINEHEKLAAPIIEQIENIDQKILPLFNEFLNSGYYPYFFEINHIESFWITLEQNIHVTIESDLIAVHPELTGNSIKKIRQLLTFIATSVPFIPNWMKIKNIVEVTDDRTLKTYIKYLEDASLIKTISKYSKQMKKLYSPEKIYLDNPNQIQAITAGNGNRGNLRETYFLNMLEMNHNIQLPAKGDFIIDGKFTFEIGGKNKDFNQLKGIENAYVASDNLETGIGRKIPLWLFGFLY